MPWVDPVAHGTRHRHRRRERRARPADRPAQALLAAGPQRTFKQFSEDKLTTWAAALTYYAILSIFPALLALMSILGLIGQSATQPLIDNLGAVAPGPAKDIVTGVLGDLQANSGASASPS